MIPFKEAKLFQNRINFVQDLEYFIYCVVFERFIDVEVYVAAKASQNGGVLLD